MQEKLREEELFNKEKGKLDKALAMGVISDEEYQEKIMSMSDALSALKDDALDADIKNEYLKKNIEKIEFSRDNDDEFILDIYF